ncbi:MAG: hypothetical protein ACI35U_08495 [Marinilabiliaceae bacterium]|nr:hypothetical protein [Bacteroidales bacterium]
MKTKKFLCLAIVTLMILALSSCAGTAKKKKYRFGGCHAQVESATSSSYSAA